MSSPGASAEIAIIKEVRTPGPSGRLLYLDALRIGLMTLGIFYHAALVYSHATWKVNDPQQRYFFSHIANSIHLFRMPAFFFISGFLADFAIRRRGLREFTKRRLLRLGLPFLATLFTFNVLENLLSAYTRSELARPFTLATTVQLIADRLFSGQLAGHLWFLRALLCYTAGMYVVGSLCASVRFARWRPLLARLGQPRWIFLIAPLSTIVLTHLSWKMDPVAKSLGLGMVAMPSEALPYLPYFLLGMLCGRLPELWDGFAATNRWYAYGCAAMAGAISVAWLGDGQLGPLAAEYLNTTAALTATGLVISFGRRFLSPVVISTAQFDLSYVGYLFHQCLIVFFATLLLRIQMPISVKYLLLVAATTAFCYLAFRIVRFNPVLHLLFTGQTNGKKEETPVTYLRTDQLQA